MTPFAALLTIAGAIFIFWWMLSVRSALKAIQRKLGADPVQNAKAWREAQKKEGGTNG